MSERGPDYAAAADGVHAAERAARLADRVETLGGRLTLTCYGAHWSGVLEQPGQPLITVDRVRSLDSALWHFEAAVRTQDRARG